MALDPSVRAKLRRKLTAGLVSVAVELTNEAKVRATRHVDTGERRNSITHAELPNGSVVWGLPGNVKNAALELGFRPHWVPAAYIGVWMRRHGLNSRKLTRRVAGLYVGGPGSRLDSGPGGASGIRRIGNKNVFGRWRTRGEVSRYLAPGKVGHSVLRHTVATRLKSIAPAAFVRGYQRG
ncbi:hypothetical protein [Meiothermus sp. Pnk-1]|uniref:hypothetical protein n=1 Tax=Meiothermus sp. Pnk-1 TaxID=873128 RepID=UPI000D7C267E|nr:hypothetical protein [Meiothermus sp. Pnk-1]PZA08640.1 hypothetical protein DNA98_00895 [Meiothermus sp. Pnk-1]